MRALDCCFCLFSVSGGLGFFSGSAFVLGAALFLARGKFGALFPLGDPCKRAPSPA